MCFARHVHLVLVTKHRGWVVNSERSRVSGVARIRPLDLIGEQAIPVAAEF